MVTLTAIQEVFQTGSSKTVLLMFKYNWGTKWFQKTRQTIFKQKRNATIDTSDNPAWVQMYEY